MIACSPNPLRTLLIDQAAAPLCSLRLSFACAQPVVHHGMVMRLKALPKQKLQVMGSRMMDVVHFDVALYCRQSVAHNIWLAFGSTCSAELQQCCTILLLVPCTQVRSVIVHSCKCLQGNLFCQQTPERNGYTL